MKKIIQLVSLFLILSTTATAQLENKRISVNTRKIQKKRQINGVKVDFNKLKNATDFRKFNIPIAQISKEKLKAKSTNKWRITPVKPKDGQLELKSIFGVTSQSHWQTGIEVKNFDPNFTDFSSNFPLSIKFRVSGGVEYRLKLKDEMRNRYGYLYIAIRDIDGRHSFVNRVEFDRNNELHYSFYEERSKDIVIDISFVSTNVSHQQIDYKCLKLSEIEINRLDKTE
jgi:hypothetical protein